MVGVSRIQILPPGLAADQSAQQTARWFDGRSTRTHDVRLHREGDELVMRHSADGWLQRHALSSLNPAEAWAAGPLPVALADGSTLWVPQSQRALLYPGQAVRPSGWVARWIASWAGVGAAVLVLLALLIWFDRQGVGLMAEAVVEVTPLRVDAALGKKAAEQIEQRWLAPSTLNPQRRQALQARFAEVAQRMQPGTPVRLEFRRWKNAAGYNAFALPHGLIFVLDGLAADMTDDELMAVLGHEMGHVEHRHGMKGLLRSLGLLAVAGTVLTDFSTVAATTVSSLQSFRYGRDAEREADAYARRFVAAAGLPPTVLLQVWRKFLEEQRRSGVDEVPGWLSTHPSTEERLRTEEAQQPAAIMK